jgi:hypothetical protein
MRTDLWVPVDRPVQKDMPAVKKCPHCGEALRLVKESDAYRFPVHETLSADSEEPGTRRG